MSKQMNGFLFALCWLLKTPIILGQTTVIAGQTITTPQVFNNLDSLIIQDCLFENIIGDAIRFDNVGYVSIKHSSFRNIINTVPTRAVICGRNSDLVFLFDLQFEQITGTAIRFPTDGASLPEHRLKKVVIDSIQIHNLRASNGIEANGIRIFHTDSLIVRRVSLCKIDQWGIVLGRNSYNPIQFQQRVGYCLLEHNRIDSVMADGILSVENVLSAMVQYNTISNIAINGIGHRPEDGDHGIYWQSPGGVLQHNTIYNVLDGQVSGNPGSGISLRTNASVVANYIHHCTGNGIGYFNDHPGKSVLSLENNIIYDTDRNGIYINGSNNNNIDPASVSHPDTLLIWHNTVMNQKIQDLLHHSCPLAVNNMSSKNYIRGNLLVYEAISDTTKHLSILGNTPHYQIDYNFLTAVDPGFVNYLLREFHLTDSCPAVDYLPAGIQVSALDFEGNPRDSRPDAGALEKMISSSINTYVWRRPVVFPNPFDEYLSIQNSSVNAFFQLYNFTGQQVWSGNNLEHQDWSMLAPGWYILTLQEGNERYTYQLLKMD